MFHGSFVSNSETLLKILYFGRDMQSVVRYAMMMATTLVPSKGGVMVMVGLRVVVGVSFQHQRRCHHQHQHQQQQQCIMSFTPRRRKSLRGGMRH
jgi:hypothetical protein